MEATCEHGASNNWWWDGLKGAGWAGGLSVCQCCGAQFGYIDSFFMMGKETSGRSWTKDLCGKCGGHYEEY